MRSACGGITKLARDKWRVSVELPKDPSTHKRKRKSKIIHGTRKDAELAKTMLLAKYADYEPSNEITVEQYAEAFYLPEIKREVKERTYEAYAQRARRYVIPTIGDMRLDEITAPKVRKWLAYIEVTPAMRKEAFKTLRQIMQHAVYMGVCTSNPCLQVKMPRVPHYEPDVLNARQAAGYLQYFTGTAIEAAVILAIGGGLRRGEICALHYNNIDWDVGAVRVSKSVVQTRSGTYIDTTKNERSRLVHIPPLLLARLQEILEYNSYVLKGRKQPFMAPDSLTRAYERLLVDLPDDLPRVAFRNLRHTSLTLAYDSGAKITEVRDRAGHSSQAVTERYYLRPHASNDADIAYHMGQALEGLSYATEDVHLAIYRITHWERF